MNLSWAVNIPWLARCRVAAVRWFAELCHVPVIIDVVNMKEFKLAEIAEYIGDCEKLFGPIFDLEKLPEFRIWAWDLLAHPRVIDNQFNLHIGPVEMTALFFNIAYDSRDVESVAKLSALYEKYRLSGLHLKYEA